MEKTFGSIIRRFREDRGYSLRQVSKGILSASFLSKVERGTSDISISNFLQLIDRLNITLEEFSFVAKQYKLEDWEQLQMDILFAHQKKNKKKLKQIMIAEHDKGIAEELETSICNSIMAEICLLDLEDKTITKEKKEYLISFLRRAASWGKYELILYTSTMKALTIDNVIDLSQKAIEKSPFHTIVPSNRTQMVLLLLQTINYALTTNYLKEAEQFITIVEKLKLNESFVYEKLKLLFYQGILAIKQGQIEKGTNKAQAVITILSTVGLKDKEAEYQDYLSAVSETK